MTNAMTSPWTDEAIGTLKELWPTQSARQIAFAMWERHKIQVSRNAVVGKAFRLGLCITTKTKVSPHTHTSFGDGQSSRRILRNVRESIRIIPAGSGGALRIVKSVIVEEPAPAQCPSSLGLTIEQLEPHHCRFITDDGAHYCGATIFKYSFCRFHFNIAYLPPQKKRAA